VALLPCFSSLGRASSVGFIVLSNFDPNAPSYLSADGATESLPAAAFTFQIYNDTNKPLMKFTNKSPAASITEFIVTIGDTAYNFDFALKQNVGTSTGMSWKRVMPDDNDSGGVRSDFVQYHNFKNFLPGRTFTFKTDIDEDNKNTVEDYRKVLFNNGDAPNSVVTVYFSNGLSASLTLPDGPMNERYSFSAEVPLPPAVWAGLGLLGIVVGGRRAIRVRFWIREG